MSRTVEQVEQMRVEEEWLAQLELEELEQRAWVGVGLLSRHE